MRDTIISLNKELDGVDLVLEKLVTKANVSVFDKLCGNCNRIFDSFCEMSIVEIVKSGNASLAIQFLKRLKEQLQRLYEYKENLVAYIEMENSNTMPSVEKVNDKATEIATVANKTLILANQEEKAA